MQIRLQATKTIEENAGRYFDQAKKIKKKIPGVKETIARYELKRISEEKRLQVQQEKQKQVRKKEWFEKFRWCYSSSGFLMIGGRDATTNEIIIKKHLEKNDIVFHTELPGSPFIIVKNPEGKLIDEETRTEAAVMCASFSKSWKAERSTAEVYWITPEQVSKEAQAGEYLPKGSFMIYGKRNYMTPKLELAIGSKDGMIMCGPLSAVSAQCTPIIRIVQGKGKPSDTAKRIQKTIGGEIDEIIRTLPPECIIKK